MSFFQRALAKIGVGGATVDAQLHSSRIDQGGLVEGEIVLRGGTVDQEMEGITLSLKTIYEKEKDDYTEKITTVIHRQRLSEPFSLRAKEEKKLPFSFDVPFVTPVTYGNSRVWLETELDIKGAFDPEDKDLLEISPVPVLKDLMKGLEQKGLKIRKVECEAAPRWMKAKMPYVQKFEFVPVSGTLRSQFDEIELYIIELSHNRLEGIVEIDKKATSLGGWLAEALDMDESYRRVLLHGSGSSLADQFIDTITQN